MAQLQHLLFTALKCNHVASRSKSRLASLPVDGQNSKAPLVSCLFCASCASFHLPHYSCYVLCVLIGRPIPKMHCCYRTKIVEKTKTLIEHLYESSILLQCFTSTHQYCLIFDHGEPISNKCKDRFTDFYCTHHYACDPLCLSDVCILDCVVE